MTEIAELVKRAIASRMVSEGDGYDLSGAIDAVEDVQKYGVHSPHSDAVAHAAGGLYRPIFVAALPLIRATWNAILAATHAEIQRGETSK